MINELIQYKQTHYPDDRRRIQTCGIPEGKILVEWLNPAAPGVDSNWEMQLYGLVRTTPASALSHDWSRMQLGCEPAPS